MFSCFQAIEIISSCHGMPTWIPMSFNSGKSQATASSVMGCPTPLFDILLSKPSIDPLAFVSEHPARSILHKTDNTLRGPVPIHTNADIDERRWIPCFARHLQMPYAFHAIKRINASQSIKTIGVFFACSCNNFIACDSNPACRLFLHEQQWEMLSQCPRFPSAPAFHPMTIQSWESPCIHLPTKKSSPQSGLCDRLLGPNIHHRIDGFVIVIIFFTHAENDSKSWANILYSDTCKGGFCLRL